MKKCMACNSEIDDDCLYCPKCGAKVEEKEDSETVQSSFGQQSPFGQ